VYPPAVYDSAGGEVCEPQTLIEVNADGRLNSRAGVFALSLATWHGMRIVSYIDRLHEWQLTADPATDITTSHRRALLHLAPRRPQVAGRSQTGSCWDRADPQLQSMKALKTFLPSLYSEYLLTAPTVGPAQPNQDNLLLGSELGEKPAHTEAEGDLRGPGGEGRGTYDRGLGETFGFPGDARKMRERSKMKLWREYFLVHGRNLTCALPGQHR